MNTITVEAARDRTQVETGQCDVVFEFDTIAEAKRKARYYLSDDYRRVSEASDCLGFSRVLKNGEVIAEFGQG